MKVTIGLVLSCQIIRLMQDYGVVMKMKKEDWVCRQMLALMVFLSVLCVPRAKTFYH